MPNPALLRVGQVAAKIRVTVKENGVALNLSTATVKNLLFRKPDGTLLTKAAIFTTDGADGRIEYVTVINDVDIEGPWIGQPYIEMGGATFHASMFSFQVGGVLTA